jgi:hypothetical protein
VPKNLTLSRLNSKLGREVKCHFKTFAEESKDNNPALAEAIAFCEEIIAAGEDWIDNDFPPT